MLYILFEIKEIFWIAEYNSKFYNLNNKFILKILYQ